VVAVEGALHRVGNLAERGARPRGFDGGLQQVALADDATF
jgi:hypothetical protein